MNTWMKLEGSSHLEAALQDEVIQKGKGEMDELVHIRLGVRDTQYTTNDYKKCNAFSIASFCFSFSFKSSL